jgi:hypothetical protein
MRITRRCRRCAARAVVAVDARADTDANCASHRVLQHVDNSLAVDNAMRVAQASVLLAQFGVSFGWSARARVALHRRAVSGQAVRACGRRSRGTRRRSGRAQRQRRRRLDERHDWLGGSHAGGHADVFRARRLAVAVGRALRRAVCAVGVRGGALVLAGRAVVRTLLARANRMAPLHDERGAQVVAVELFAGLARASRRWPTAERAPAREQLTAFLLQHCVLGFSSGDGLDLGVEIAAALRFVANRVDARRVAWLADALHLEWLGDSVHAPAVGNASARRARSTWRRRWCTCSAGAARRGARASRRSCSAASTARRCCASRRCAFRRAASSP